MIEVKNLTKKYGNHEAVSDLSFTVENGQIYGFLGPNGAGKTTTMNIMTGCLSATSGEVKINGFDIFEQPVEAKRQIGYLPEQPPLYMERTPREYLKFVAEAKGVKSDRVKNEIERVMEITHITDVSDRLNKYLSKGYRQRVGLAQALIGDPDIIILDEPTVGLDPSQIIEIRDLIRKLAEKHTVILSTHILQEVQALCSTILIISKGRLVACDTPDNLERIFTPTVSVELDVEASDEDIKNMIKELSPLKDFETTVHEDGAKSLIISFDESEERKVCRKIFKACCDNNITILKMVSSRASLEDVFIELTNSENTNSQSADIRKKKEESQKENSELIHNDEVSKEARKR